MPASDKSDKKTKPEGTATPEQKARRVARNEFKTARAQWVEAKARIDQIKAKLAAVDLPDTEKKTLHAEMKDLRSKLPAMGEAVRATKATWMELKAGAKGSGPADGSS